MLRLRRLTGAGPRPWFRLAMASAACTGALAAGIALTVHPAGALPKANHMLLLVALAVLGFSVLLGAVTLVFGRGPWRGSRADRLVPARQRAAIWLALAVWTPFLLAVVYYRAGQVTTVHYGGRVIPASSYWLYYGFDDKRWETALYLLTALGPLLVLTAASRVIAVAHEIAASAADRVTWRMWLAGIFPSRAANEPEPAAAGSGATVTDTAAAPAGQHGPASWWRGRYGAAVKVALGLATALAVSWYFFGPPWYLTQDSTAISGQETIWFGSLQAIAKGYLPYASAAKVQYGPGTQLATYWLMRHVTSFSIVGFRQAWALWVWAGAFAFFAIFFLAFGYVRGLVISLVSVIVVPGFGEVKFQVGGTFAGYMGWADPLRYAGMLALVALLPALLRRRQSRWTLAGSFALGAFWGVSNYLAQENLIAGLVGGLAITGLLLLSRTVSWRAVWTALVAIAAGSVVVWLPILIWYAVEGKLVPFVKLYFILATAMSQGFGNRPWVGTAAPAINDLFYGVPFLLAAIGFLTAFDVRPLRIATDWTPERTRLAVAVIVTTLLYQGVLLRSDATDITGTELALAALIVMAVTTLPGLLGGNRLRGAGRPLTLTAAGAVLAFASLLLMPANWYSFSNMKAVALAPYQDRQRLGAEPSPATPKTLAGQRIGPGLADAPQCCQHQKWTMAEFASDMERVHTLVGQRTAYVADFPHAYPGLVYFVADLKPAPTDGDKYNTVLNQTELDAFMADFQANVLPHVQALITEKPGKGKPIAEEAQMFLARYPDAKKVLIHFGEKPYYVLLAP